MTDLTTDLAAVDPAAVVAAVAARGLGTAHELPPCTLSDDAFAAVAARCEHERVLGLLGAAVRDGAFPVTPAQRALVEAAWQRWLAHAVRLERLLLDVDAALTDHGIDALALKGVALAHASYPDPAARVFGDIDLLVMPGRLHQAAGVVAKVCGGTRPEPEVRAGFDDRFGREVLVRVHGAEVDLHRTFVNGAYGAWLDPASLFATSATVTIGGRAVRTLTPGDRLLHAAYHTVLSDWPSRLVANRDLAQVVLHDDPPADAVVARARSWRAEAVLAAGIRHAWHSLRLTDRPALVGWAVAHRTPLRDRWLMAAARGPARGYTSQLTTVVALPGVRERAAFLRAVAWPDPAFREARRLGRFGLLGAGARKARHG